MIEHRYEWGGSSIWTVLTLPDKPLAVSFSPLDRGEEFDDDRAVHAFRRRTDLGDFGEGIERGLIEQQAAG